MNVSLGEERVWAVDYARCERKVGTDQVQTWLRCKRKARLELSQPNARRDCYVLVVTVDGNVMVLST